MSRKYKPPQTRLAEAQNLPDWGLNDRKDYPKLNADVIKECNSASKSLVVAWGKGGAQGIKGV
jgi:hypothetical protein